MKSNQNFAKTVAFAAGATVSGILRVGPEYAIVGFRTDSNWQAATITVSSSMEDENATSPTDFLSLVDDGGTAISFPSIGASKQVCTSQGVPLLIGNHFKFTSSATQTPGTTLTVILRPT